MKERSNKKGSFQQFAENSTNWFLKAASLGCAIILWFNIAAEETVEKTVQIPMDIINLPRELVISNQFKKELEVTLSGSRSVILEMDIEKITRQVDLVKEIANSEATIPGTLVIKNDNEHIKVPRNLTVERVQPASIILSLDKLIQKKLPVIANTVGNVADGFEIQEISMNPESIVLTGPETLLQPLNELQTNYISINALKESKQIQVPLELSPALVDLIGETSVTAEVIVKPVMVTEVATIPIKQDKNSFDFEPKKVSVTARFPKILQDEGEELKNFIHAEIIPDIITGTQKVIVKKHNTRGLPIEVLSIIPNTVQEILPPPIEEDTSPIPQTQPH